NLDTDAAPTLNANGGTQVAAFVSNSDIDAEGDVSVTANSSQTITANVIAAAAALAGSDSVAVGVAGAGTYAENRIAVRTSATITGTSGDRATISGEDITVSATDTATIMANVGAAAISAAFSGGAG